MRTLADLHAQGGEPGRFAQEFVQRVHRGHWAVAKDHWTSTVRHIADNLKELEDMPPAAAARRAEELALHLALGLASLGKCWACAQDPARLSAPGSTVGS